MKQGDPMEPGEENVALPVFGLLLGKEIPC